MWDCGLDYCGSGQRQMTGCCECGNEPSNLMKWGDFFGWGTVGFSLGSQELVMNRVDLRLRISVLWQVMLCGSQHFAFICRYMIQEHFWLWFEIYTLSTSDIGQPQRPFPKLWSSELFWLPLATRWPYLWTKASIVYHEPWGHMV